MKKVDPRKMAKIKMGQSLEKRKESRFDVKKVAKAKLPVDEGKLLRILMDNIPDTIYFKDRKSRFIIINKAQADFIGLAAPHEAIGKTDFDFFQHAKEAFEDEQKIIKTGEPLIGKIEKVGKSDGTYRWYSATKIPIFDRRGKIVGTCGISRDITEIKNYEGALEKAKRELELRVQQRTADLEAANKILKERLAQLNFLTSVSYELAQFIDIDELCPAVIEAFRCRIPGSEVALCRQTLQGFKFLCGSEAFSGESQKICCEKVLDVFKTTRLYAPFMIRNWRADEGVGKYPWKNLQGLPCYIVVPFIADNQLIAILQIFAMSDFTDRYEQELPVLTTLSVHAAICLSNTIKYSELGEKARLDGELNAARSIQRRFTPNYKPSIPHINLKGVYCPAYEVSGDYLDYFQTEAGNWVIAIADVCGKGIPAALLMTILRSAFRSEAKNAISAKQLLCSVNELMKAHLDNRSFVTALCLIINKDGTVMSYSRAGHPFLIEVGKYDKQPPRNIDSNGIAMGLTTDVELFESLLEEKIIPLKEGNLYLIYTDGLIDALNSEKKTYGIKRLLAVLEENSALRVDSLIEKIMDDVKSFTQDAQYNDDLTMLAFEVTKK